jgi:3-hydroxyisobutyrate dehydrogenase-like beta-hydroxyacid dehydrogenase
MTDRIGLPGTGRMGIAMVHRLLDAGWQDLDAAFAAACLDEFHHGRGRLPAVRVLQEDQCR